MSKGDPDWGQSFRNTGERAGGKHTRGNKGQKPGCLDSVVILAGLGTAVTYAVERLLG
jgi:hypothetical protein